MRFFCISELLYSKTAVDHKIWNGCTYLIEKKLEQLVEHVLDPARAIYGKPVRVSSGYRCPKLNALVGGANNSQHLMGEAADVYTDDGVRGNLALAKIIVERTIFDQLILEGTTDGKLNPTWVHVSYKYFGINRGEILVQRMGIKGYYTLDREELLAYATD